MRLIALMDFHLGLGNAAEVLRAGDTFTPPGTGVMNVADHARSLIATGACLSADDPRATPRIERFRQVRDRQAEGRGA